jgi:adenylate cyclase class 2
VEFAPIRSRLQECGGTRVGQFLETNLFFDTEDRTLLAGDQGLRLRISREMQTQHEAYTLTHKGPRQHGSMKNREETELSVGEPAAAIGLMERLGYVRMLSFEKKRETWKLDGCKVELDEVPFLGQYVEIEGPREETIRKVQEKLGLRECPMVKASYVALLMTYLQEQGDPQRTVAFAPDMNTAAPSSAG